MDDFNLYWMIYSIYNNHELTNEDLVAIKEKRLIIYHDVIDNRITKAIMLLIKHIKLTYCIDNVPYYVKKRKLNGMVARIRQVHVNFHLYYCQACGDSSNSFYII